MMLDITEGGAGKPDQNQMELTLRYRGVVHSANGSGRVDEKGRIRKELSHQLEEYWRTDKRLDGMYASWRDLQIPALSKGRFEVNRPLSDGTKFWWRFPLVGHNYIPLVTRILMTTVELDIRLYRRREPDGVLYAGGDIDNRLKVFLDSLQVPKNTNEVQAEAQPDENPSNWPPIFCLVDDDSAVTRLSVQCFKLLTEIPGGIRDEENYLELDVDVKITPITPMMGTLMLQNP